MLWNLILKDIFKDILVLYPIVVFPFVFGTLLFNEEHIVRQILLILIYILICLLVFVFFEICVMTIMYIIKKYVKISLNSLIIPILIVQIFDLIGIVVVVFQYSIFRHWTFWSAFAIALIYKGFMLKYRLRKYNEICNFCMDR